MKIVAGVAMAAGAVTLAAVNPAASAWAWKLGALGASMTLGGIADEMRGGTAGAQNVRQPAASRVTLYGQSRIQGVLIYEGTTGHQLNFVMAWASHPCKSIDALYLDGRELHLKANGDDDGGTYYDESGNKYSFGSKVAAFSSLGPYEGQWLSQLNVQNTKYWTSDCTLNGICATYIKCTADTSKFSGPPNIKAAIHGKCDIYDPRTGARGWTDNAALIIADWLCNKDYGIGLDYATEIDEDQLIAAANICDENVPLAIGGYERRYTINGTFEWTANPGDTLDSLLMSCAGRISWVGGKYRIYPGAWYGSSLSFGPQHVVGKVDWSTRRKGRDLVNAVRATYICPVYPYSTFGYDRNHRNPNIFSGEFQPADMPEYAQDERHGYPSDANLIADGGDRNYADIKFQFVQSCATAQRLAKIYMLRKRQPGSGTLVMNLAAYRAVAQDVIQMTLPAFGWDSRYLEVQKSHFDLTPGDGKDAAPSLSVTLEVADTNPSIYSWSVAEERGVEDTPSPVRADALQVLAPTNITLESAQAAVVGVDGVVQPRIHVTWTQPDDPFVLSGGHIEIMYQQAGATSWIAAGTYVGETVSAYIAGVKSGIDYYVQLRSIRASGATSDWVTAGAHTVADSRTKLSGDSVYYPDGNTVSYLQPAAPGADVTAQQALSYTGASENLVPNGNFILGNIQGWGTDTNQVGGVFDPSYKGCILLDSTHGTNSAMSPSFRVEPGKKYRLTFRVWGGSQNRAYLRMYYAPTYSAVINQSGSGWGYLDLLAYATIPTTPTDYVYDWTCPSGFSYASMSLITVGGSVAGSLFQCIAYGGVGQWGADVTGQNTAADTNYVNGVAASVITQQLYNISSDNILSKGEKSTVIVDWTTLDAEQASLDGQAVAYGVASEKSAYDNAVSALRSYLVSLQPAWNDTSNDTPIDGGTFRSYWNNAYNARSALVSKIYDVSKMLSATGSSENIIPNGKFTLGNLLGWKLIQGGSVDYVNADGGAVLLHESQNSGVVSPSFNVIPGRKYRFTYRAWMGSGNGGIYFRIFYAPIYAANIDTTVSGWTYGDFLANASIPTVPTEYSYDWVCPDGYTYASVGVYAIGSSALACSKVSCVPYSASAEWGSDNTRGHVKVFQSATDSGPINISLGAYVTPFDWTIAAYSTTDVFNLSAVFAWSFQSNYPSGVVRAYVVVDGNTSSSINYGGGVSVGHSAGGNCTVIGTITGLPAGSHRIQVWAISADNSSVANPTVFKQYCYGQLQQVF